MGLVVPQASVPHFTTLSQLLTQAYALVDARQLVVPAVPPELRDLGAWLCREVATGSTLREGNGLP